MRTLLKTVREYTLLSLALLALVAAGILTLTHHANIASWVLVAASAIILVPLFVGIIKDIRNGRYGVDILAILAIGTALVLQQNWAAIVVIIMLTGGKSLENFAAARARSELKDLLRRAPQHAHLLQKGKETEVLAASVREGDSIVVRPGETVPVDAVLTQGTSSFDETSLTGESLPVTKDVGDVILSGAVNGDAVVTARAIHSAADSQYQQIIRLVRAAAEHPAPFVRLADRYSIPFTVIALTIGGIAWVLSRQPIRFLEVLVVATPCPLILATPIALIAGMSRAARDGIIIKTGTALELLAEAKTFAFDKTGTLTYGTPALDRIVAFRPFRNDQILGWAAALEKSSNHVLAAAIQAAAADQKLRLPKAKHVHERTGLGLEAHVQGADVIVGRYKFLLDRSIQIPATFDPHQVTQTATFVAVDGQLAGYLTFHDNIRREAKTTLRALYHFDVQDTVMVTGDHQQTAEKVAHELGIKEVAADTLPAGKIQVVERLKTRPVAFVGDGVNDAPVLMAADIGIALGARGSTAASESADVVIMKDDLRYVALAVGLAKRTFRIATQSIFVGIGLSIGLMLIFATGRFSPIIGALVQEVVDVIVILNALRAHNPGKSLPRI